MKSVNTLLKLAQLWWTGHAQEMPDMLFLVELQKVKLKLIRRNARGESH